MEQRSGGGGGGFAGGAGSRQRGFLTAEVSGDYAGLFRLVTRRNYFWWRRGEPTIVDTLAPFEIRGAALAA